MRVHRSSLAGKIVPPLLGLILLVACHQSATRVPEVIEPLPDSLDPDTYSEMDQPVRVVFDYDTSQWVEIPDQPPYFLDLRYAGDHNFVHRTIYPCGRCLLKKAAGEALLSLKDSLNAQGLGMVLWDCYRPAQAQQVLWESFPNASYVTPPSRGSMHSRGLAVDLGLTDAAGNLLDLGSDFDHFGPEAHRDFSGLTQGIRERRQMLDRWMTATGFGGIRTEWWHYSYRQAFAPVDSFQWGCISANE